MTNEEYEELMDALRDDPRKEETLARIRKKYPCIGCHWNDGLPHSACYSCDD